MIWNYIRDFFVQFIFGGVTSGNVAYDCGIGRVFRVTQGGSTFVNSNTLYLKSGSYVVSGQLQDCYLSIGDWLSTTATIITLCLVVAFLFLVVRYLFKVCAGLFTFRG